MTKRYYVVQHTFTLVHELEPSIVDGGEDYQPIHIEDNNCCLNVLDEMEDKRERDGEGVCDLCRGYEAKVLGAYASVSEAKVAHSGIVPLEGGE